MRKLAFGFLCALCVLVALMVGCGSVEKSEEVRLSARVKFLIQQLGDTDWLIREKAQSELAQIGEPAEPFLKEIFGNKNTDPEIRMRAQYLLQYSQWKNKMEMLEQVHGDMWRCWWIDDYTYYIPDNQGSSRLLVSKSEAPKAFDEIKQVQIEMWRHNHFRANVYWSERLNREGWGQESYGFACLFRSNEPYLTNETIWFSLVYRNVTGENVVKRIRGYKIQLVDTGEVLADDTNIHWPVKTYEPREWEHINPSLPSMKAGRYKINIILYLGDSNESESIIVGPTSNTVTFTVAEKK